MNYKKYLTACLCLCLLTIGIKITAQSIDLIPMGRSFDLSFQIEETKDAQFIVAHLNLKKGSYIISPYSEDNFYGPLAISISEQEFVSLNSRPLEIPKAKEEFDPVLEKPVRFVRANTTYKQKLKIERKEDFEVSGEIWLLLEPACIPYVVKFTLSQTDGELGIKKNTTVIHESYKK